MLSFLCWTSTHYFFQSPSDNMFVPGWHSFILCIRMRMIQMRMIQMRMIQMRMIRHACTGPQIGEFWRISNEGRAGGRVISDLIFFADFLILNVCSLRCWSWHKFDHIKYCFIIYAHFRSFLVIIYHKFGRKYSGN